MLQRLQKKDILKAKKILIYLKIINNIVVTHTDKNKASLICFYLQKNCLE